MLQRLLNIHIVGAMAVMSLLRIGFMPGTVRAVDTTAPWQNDGQMIADDSLHNIEIMQTSVGLYRMIFSQNNTIYSTNSTDGFTWDTASATVLINDGGQVSLIKLGDTTWRMYFTRFSEFGNAMYSAISTDDGSTFTEEIGVRLQPGHPQGFDAQSGIVHPSVIQLPNGRYRVYYDTLYTQGETDTPWKILSAISEDGLTFTHEPGVRLKPRDLPQGREADAVWSPFVELRNGRYYLYFTAQYSEDPLTRNGIYVAVSKNGKKFNVKPNKPLVYRDADLGEAENTMGGMNGAPQDPFVMQADNQRWLYFWITEQGLFRAHR